jgi:hypothetical protein
MRVGSYDGGVSGARGGPREEAEGRCRQYKSNHERLKALDGLDRKADNGAVARRRRPQFSPTGRVRLSQLRTAMKQR